MKVATPVKDSTDQAASKARTAARQKAGLKWSICPTAFRGHSAAVRAAAKSP